MTQLGLHLRDSGLDAVEDSHAKFVELIRAEAMRIARYCGVVTIDDLRIYAKEKCLEPKHPNAWGSVFRGPHWHCVARRKSTIPSNHAREVKVWSLKQ